MSEESERSKSFDGRFNFYDYAGFIAPGTALLLGLLYLVPEFREPTVALMKESSLGALGLFILVAYVVGHVLEGIAYPIDRAMWLLWRGRPAEWIATGRILIPEQRALLLDAVNKRFDLKLASFDVLKKQNERDALIRQIRAAVAANARSGFLERLNGNYGLARGVAAACLVLLVVSGISGTFYDSEIDWAAIVVLVIAFLAAATRMWESHYFHAVELFVEFLNLPPRLEQQTKARCLCDL